MSWLLTFQIAVTALRRNLMRTMLTMRGMIIGVGAVITLVALGSGAHSAIEEQVMEAGTNLIIVSAGNRTEGGVRLGMGASSRLSEDGVTAIRGQVGGIQYVAPGLRTRSQVAAPGDNWSTSIEGTGPDLPFIRSWPLEYGAFFGPTEVTTADRVAVLGSIVRDALFGLGADPVGRTIRIGGQPFTVLGVLAPTGQSATGQDQDDVVFVPYSTVQKKMMGVTYLNNITLGAGTPTQSHSSPSRCGRCSVCGTRSSPAPPTTFVSVPWTTSSSSARSRPPRCTRCCWQLRQCRCWSEASAS
ncbi:MAG: ABC transporter permease [Acidobacteria bacterium]|nr:ABC transporter permease [Acidobacteriota bacterium]MBA3885392.1 ABC transporter permease [Acidobacteriota bacterium]